MRKVINSLVEMIRSTELLVFAFASIILWVNGNHTNINESETWSCSKKFYYNGSNYPKFTNFVNLSSLKYGTCDPSIVHIRFYHNKGSAPNNDFRVLFSHLASHPKSNEKFFNICKLKTIIL